MAGRAAGAYAGDVLADLRHARPDTVAPPRTWHRRGRYCVTGRAPSSAKSATRHARPVPPPSNASAPGSRAPQTRRAVRRQSSSRAPRMAGAWRQSQVTALLVRRPHRTPTKAARPRPPSPARPNTHPRRAARCGYAYGYDWLKPCTRNLVNQCVAHDCESGPGHQVASTSTFPARPPTSKHCAETLGLVVFPHRNAPTSVYRHPGA